MSSVRLSGAPRGARAARSRGLAASVRCAVCTTRRMRLALPPARWRSGSQPKSGGITGLTEYFPRIRKAYLIGEAAQEFASTLGDRVPHEISETLEVAVANAARDAEASGPAEP